MSDKIIRFPGPAGVPGKAKAPTPAPAPGPAAEPKPVDPANLDEDRQKAIGIIMSGMPFVIVGIKPTDRGADFFTALGGEPSDLRNAQAHLPGVIDRLYSRKGI
jgi:hypothetical protein